MDKYLSYLLAVALGCLPGSREAHREVRAWLDKSVSEWPAFDAELPVSRQAALLALRKVADPALVARLEQGEE